MVANQKAAVQRDSGSRSFEIFEVSAACRQETQRPGICANGDCPIALTMASQPSSRRGFGAGAFSKGPLTALRLLVGTSGSRSALFVRFTAGEARSIEGAAVVDETSRPMTNDATANATPQKPTRYPELRRMGCSHDPCPH